MQDRLRNKLFARVALETLFLYFGDESSEGHIGKAFTLQGTLKALFKQSYPINIASKDVFVVQEFPQWERLFPNSTMPEEGEPFYNLYMACLDWGVQNDSNDIAGISDEENHIWCLIILAARHILDRPIREKSPAEDILRQTLYRAFCAFCLSQSPLQPNKVSVLQLGVALRVAFFKIANQQGSRWGWLNSEEEYRFDGLRQVLAQNFLGVSCLGPLFAIPDEQQMFQGKASYVLQDGCSGAVDISFEFTLVQLIASDCNVFEGGELAAKVLAYCDQIISAKIGEFTSPGESRSVRFISDEYDDGEEKPTPRGLCDSLEDDPFRTPNRRPQIVHAPSTPWVMATPVHPVDTVSPSGVNFRYRSTPNAGGSAKVKERDVSATGYCGGNLCCGLFSWVCNSDPSAAPNNIVPVTAGTPANLMNGGGTGGSPVGVPAPPVSSEPSRVEATTSQPRGAGAGRKAKVTTAIASGGVAATTGFAESLGGCVFGRCCP